MSWIQRFHSLTPWSRLAAGATLVLAAGATACDRDEQTDGAPLPEQPPAQPAQEQTPTDDRYPQGRQGQNVPPSRIPGNPPPGAQPGAQAAVPSDEALRKFAQAHSKVKAVKEEFGPKLSAVRDPEEARAVQKEASEATNTAVTDSGLSIDEYSKIAQMVQRDPAIRQKVLSHVEE